MYERMKGLTVRSVPRMLQEQDEVIIQVEGGGLSPIRCTAQRRGCDTGRNVD